MLPMARLQAGLGLGAEVRVEGLQLLRVLLAAPTAPPPGNTEALLILCA